MTTMEQPKSRWRRALLFAGAVAVGVGSYAIYSRMAADEAVGEEGMTTSAPAPAAMAAHGAHGHHPAPRPGIGADKVVDAARYERYPRLAAAYRAAAENPELLDGIYCYCQCHEHAGHYSLLECYFSDHAAECDVCLNEAEMAVKLDRDGVGLDGIRDIIDQTYGS